MTNRPVNNAKNKSETAFSKVFFFKLKRKRKEEKKKRSVLGNTKQSINQFADNQSNKQFRYSLETFKTTVFLSSLSFPIAMTT